jgi:hypothetical protein
MEHLEAIGPLDRQADRVSPSVEVSVLAYGILEELVESPEEGERVSSQEDIGRGDEPPFAESSMLDDERLEHLRDEIAALNGTDVATLEVPACDGRAVGRALAMTPVVHAFI